MRTDAVFDVRNFKLRCRLPLQCFGYIAGPDAPRGTVIELHDVTAVVLLDSHRWLHVSACWVDRSICRKDQGVEAAFLESEDHFARSPESSCTPAAKAPGR